MQGYPDFNFRAFANATKRLRSWGHQVFSPAERDIKVHGEEVGKSEKGDLRDINKLGFSLRDALHDDTKFICLEADAIAMLPGWENSKGAQAEWALARALSLKIMYLQENPEYDPE